MPYIRKETSKLIRHRLKTVFPQYKFSVRIQHHSVLAVTIKRGELDLLPYHGEVNEHYIKELFAADKESFEFISSLYQVIFETHPQTIVRKDTDYGDWPNYYLHLYIDNNYIQKG